VDRITNVNAMLCNANGQRRLLIDPKCQQLIRALDTLTYKKGTKVPDKSGGQDHITDASGISNCRRVSNGSFGAAGPGVTLLVSATRKWPQGRLQLGFYSYLL
jgi:hypothetical protein